MHMVEMVNESISGARRSTPRNPQPQHSGLRRYDARLLWSIANRLPSARNCLLIDAR